MAVAVAGAVLGINPFDQPDVEASKVKTRELTAAFEKTGRCRMKAGRSSEGGHIFADEQNAKALGSSDGNLLRAEGPFRPAGAGDYVRCWRISSASTPNHNATDHASAVRDQRKVATCVRIRAAFPALHRPGLQGRPQQRRVPANHRRRARDLAVPGQKASFGVIKAAQARGDFGVLAERGRRRCASTQGRPRGGTENADRAIAER